MSTLPGDPRLNLQLDYCNKCLNNNQYDFDRFTTEIEDKDLGHHYIQIDGLSCKKCGKIFYRSLNKPGSSRSAIYNADHQVTIELTLSREELKELYTAMLWAPKMLEEQGWLHETKNLFASVCHRFYSLFFVAFQKTGTGTHTSTTFSTEEMWKAAQMVAPEKTEVTTQDQSTTTAITS